jgi:hypothetical protein
MAASVPTYSAFKVACDLKTNSSQVKNFLDEIEMTTSNSEAQLYKKYLNDTVASKMRIYDLWLETAVSEGMERLSVEKMPFTLATLTHEIEIVEMQLTSFLDEMDMCAKSKEDYAMYERWMKIGAYRLAQFYAALKDKYGVQGMKDMQVAKALKSL